MKTVLNSCLLVLSLSLSAGSLWAASHLDLPYAVLAIWFFALINNMPFALMHEAVHGIAADAPRLNALIGTIAGWAFPTSFTMQRAAHIGHHQRNRTDQELYDYYLSDQSPARRNFWLYAGNLVGLYWWCVLDSNLLYALSPGIYRSRFFIERIATPLGFGPYIEDLASLPPRRVWLEVVLAFGYQAALFYCLDLSVVAYFLCNMAFALHWSVLQYADHAWSPRDVKNGAWNLRVLPPFRWLALNYHYHLAHHQQPQLPWYELPAHVDKNALQPSFWRVYFSLWKGVRPAPPMGAPADLAFLFPNSAAARREH
ncbi:MAG: fatty acid desaturase [Rhodocyclales bacterium GT-UBC]|nr:MAG: fatty acid desaturase [Rhodocyclales bacterium GT-UBC]